MVEDKRERGRPRTGTIYWARSGWRARITVDVDGVQIKRTYNLQTKNRSAALIKLKRLLVQPDIPSEDEAERFETFEEAAERIVGESDITSKDNRLGRLRNHVYGHFGFKPVNEVTAPDVRDALKAMAKKGLSQDMITHVKVDVSAVLGSLFEDEILKENVCARVSSPKGVTDRRERAVLEDDELALYLAWAHPDESHRLGVLERQKMVCISRVVGGARRVEVGVSAVLRSRCEGESLKGSVCGRVSWPTGVTDRRGRAVLEDDELGFYLAWGPPDVSHRLGVRERQRLACISRLFGGARIG